MGETTKDLDRIAALQDRKKLLVYLIRKLVCNGNILDDFEEKT